MPRIITITAFFILIIYFFYNFFYYHKLQNKIYKSFDIVEIKEIKSRQKLIIKDLFLAFLYYLIIFLIMAGITYYMKH